MNRRTVTNRSCAVGNVGGPTCLKQAEVAFRTCVSSISGAHFDLWACEAATGPCAPNSRHFPFFELRSTEAVSDGLDLSFDQIESELHGVLTGVYVQLRGSVCTLTNESGEVIELPLSYLRGEICAQAIDVLGGELWAKGDLEGATAKYREGIRIDPNFARAHQALGNALYEKGNLDESIAELREATRLDPKDDWIHVNLGDALSDKGDYDRAITEYRYAILLNPDGAWAHFGLGRGFEKKSDPPGALEEYRTASRLALTDISLTYGRSAKIREAYDRLAKSLEKK